MVREDGRADDELRPITFTRGFQTHPAGSVLVEFGGTKVLCAASVTRGVPRWRKGPGSGGSPRSTPCCRRRLTNAATGNRSKAGSAAAPTRSPG